jgi:hypothetical protein
LKQHLLRISRDLRFSINHKLVDSVFLVSKLDLKEISKQHLS